MSLLLSQLTPAVTSFVPPAMLPFVAVSGWSGMDYQPPPPNIVQTVVVSVPAVQLPPVIPSGWTLRDYGQPVPSMLPSGSTAIPTADVFAFGELPRDMTALQWLLSDRRSAFAPPRKFVPAVTAPVISSIQWSLREYGPQPAPLIQSGGSRVPLSPLPVPSFTAWSLRDYGTPVLSMPVAGTPPLVPSVEVFAFGELPRDMTALRVTLTVNSIPFSPPPPPVTGIEVYPIGFNFIRFGGTYG